MPCFDILDFIVRLLMVDPFVEPFSVSFVAPANLLCAAPISAVSNMFIVIPVDDFSNQERCGHLSAICAMTAASANSGIVAYHSGVIQL